LGTVLNAARRAGAAAVLSSHLLTFNQDPSGEERHLDAIHYGEVPPGTTLPVAHISPRIHGVVRDGMPEVTELRFVAEAQLAERPLRTVIAVVVGDERPQEVVTLVSHVQEPGANDNATGVAGLLEGARVLASLVEEGALTRPRRSLAFVWGDEYGASRVFLETTERRTVAGISADMIGASKAKTGAICLLERGPDPGAITTLPPDEHTPWGAGQVKPDTLFPNGLAVILRCAMVDVGVVAEGWETREHPWEGGSDHDVFLNAGIAGALVWHFTDFTYHTSLDRLDMVDPAELHRTAAALLVGALGVADARVTDLRRYVESAKAEGEARAGIVEIEGAPTEVAEQWVAWYQGTRAWLAALCNGEAVPDRYGR
jgi:aminopeptidase YwaD